MIALLNQRMAYINLIQGGTIDIAISPQQATISALLGHVRKGDVVNVVSLRHGLAEALEIVVHGDENTSNVIGREIGSLKLPTGPISVSAIKRMPTARSSTPTKTSFGTRCTMFSLYSP